MSISVEQVPAAENRIGQAVVCEVDGPVPFTVRAGGVAVECAQEIVDGRRMGAVRSLLAAARRDTLSLLEVARAEPTLYLGPVVASQLALLEAALAEVEAAERGCGAEDGGCTCPCHAGVTKPAVEPFGSTERP